MVPASASCRRSHAIIADSPLYKIPLVLEPQPEGGLTVTSPALPELVTEGDSAAEALANVQDALQAVLEIYQDEGRALPPGLHAERTNAPIRFEYLVKAA